MTATPLLRYAFDLGAKEGLTIMVFLWFKSPQLSFIHV